MRLFTITTMSKDIVFCSSRSSEIREFLNEWQKRKNSQLLLIHSVFQREIEDIVDDLEDEYDSDISVRKVLISSSIRQVSYEGFDFLAQVKASARYEVISSDLRDYEAYCWAKGSCPEQRIITLADNRRKGLIFLLNDEDCEDEDD